MVEPGMDYSGTCFFMVLLVKAFDAWWFQRAVMTQPRGTAAAGVAALPILALNTVLPFLFDRRYCGPGVFAHIAAVLTWVCSFKVIAYVSGRGPHFPKSMTYWAVFGALVTPAMLALPMVEPGSSKKKTNGDSTAGPGKGGDARVVIVEDTRPSAAAIVRTHLRLLALYCSLLAGIAVALKHSTALGLPTWLVQALYGAGFLCFHLTTHVPWEMLSSLISGLPALHNAWRPWAPLTVADFWGCRWNRTASAILRWVIYEPLVTGKLTVQPGTDQRPLLRAAPTWRRIAAALSTFAVSGVVHEVIWFCMTGRVMGWFMVFFVGNGLVVLAEGLLLQRLFKRAAQCSSGKTGQGAAAAAAGAPSNGKLSNGCCSGSNNSNGKQSSIRAAAKAGPSPAPLLVAAPVLIRVVRSLAVFAVIIVLGGRVMWPRLAPAIGESFLGHPGMTFEEMHVHLTS